MVKRKSMTEVVAALIWQGDKFMICQRPAHKARGLLWEFVGGKVEQGETKEQALIRECKEELNNILSVGDVFMDVIHEYPDLTVHLTKFASRVQKPSRVLTSYVTRKAGKGSKRTRPTIILGRIKTFFIFRAIFCAQNMSILWRA